MDFNHNYWLERAEGIICQSFLKQLIILRPQQVTQLPGF